MGNDKDVKICMNAKMGRVVSLTLSGYLVNVCGINQYRYCEIGFDMNQIRYFYNMYLWYESKKSLLAYSHVVCMNHLESIYCNLQALSLNLLM